MRLIFLVYLTGVWTLAAADQPKGGMIGPVQMDQWEIGKILDYYESLTGIAVFRHEPLSGSLSFKTTKPLKHTEVKTLLEAQFNLDGFSFILRRDGSAEILMAGQLVPRSLIPVYRDERELPEGVSIVTYVFKLQNVQAEDLAKVLNFYHSVGQPYTSIMASADGHEVIVTETTRCVRELVPLVRWLDGGPFPTRVEKSAMQNQGEPVKVQFENAEMREVLDLYRIVSGRQVLSDRFGREKKLSFKAGSALSLQAARNLIERALNKAEFSVILRESGVAEVLHLKPGRSAGIPIYFKEEEIPDGTSVITYVFELNHTNAVEWSNKFNQKYARDSMYACFFPLPGSKQRLLVTETTDNIREMLQTIAEKEAAWTSREP